MKKMLFFVMAIAAMAFTSCSNNIDEQVAEQPAKINFNIQVADLDNGSATRAVKKSWANGDKLNIWFDDNVGFTPHLVLTYNGSEWVADECYYFSQYEDKSGYMRVVFEGYNDFENKYTYNIYNGPYFTAPTANTSREAYCTPLTVFAENISYTWTANTSTLAANINSWRYQTPIQFVVTGLDPAEAADYALRAYNRTKSQTVYSANTWKLANGNTGITSTPNKEYIGGVANEDGVAFYFTGDGNLGGEDVEYGFTLQHNSDAYSWSHTATITVDNTKCHSIKINKSKFGL